ncbi:MAG TPA: hypothetical protein VLE44_02385 [Candidatus Saccharimonadales bacterium]|nr:hypothetical protein [Candidatus Saccharimonadales bacterium]
MVERVEQREKIFEGKKIFVAAPIKGVPNPNPHLVGSMVRYLKEGGATVLSEHVAAETIEELNSMFIKENGIDRFNIDNPSPAIRTANLISIEIAEYFIGFVDTPSAGVTILMHEAIRKHRMGMNLTPVLCLVSEDKWEELSNMVKGISENDSPAAEVRKYVSTEHAKRVARDFLLKY